MDQHWQNLLITEQRPSANKGNTIRTRSHGDLMRHERRLVETDRRNCEMGAAFVGRGRCTLVA